MNVDLAPMASFLRRLALAVPANADSASDADLLGDFVSRSDETAFAALMSRYGPMVLRVCRRILGDPNAAEDAFQATFLILATRARSVRRQECLIGWLHGVARRVALMAKAARDRRPVLECVIGPLNPASNRPDPLTQLTGRELLNAIHEEIDSLPDVYRVPILLCCVEGKSREEAGQQLGWSASSIKGRLERGKSRLQVRLARRGLSLSAALAALILPEAALALSAERLLATVKAASALVAGQRLPEAMACNVSTLVEGALKAMFLVRLKTAAVVVLVACILGAGGAILGVQVSGGPNAEVGREAVPRPGQLQNTVAEKDDGQVAQKKDEPPPLPKGAAEAQTPEELAKHAALRFAKAFREHSVDGMIKEAGLPFHFRPNGAPMGSTFGDPGPLVKTQMELRQKLKGKVHGTLPDDIDRIVEYMDYRNKNNWFVSGDDLKVLDEVAGKGSLVVFLTKKGKNGSVPLVVKVEKDRAKVVGFVMTWSEKDEKAAKAEVQTSPHADAIQLVIKTQQARIREVDPEDWEHDTKERTWTVRRPFSPGTIDSRHLFNVSYRIDGKEVAAWLVDSSKGLVQPEHVKAKK
jgi:RNA polymerase sigma factor (sigma-70 family)